jgi:hypothetical protein
VFPCFRYLQIPVEKLSGAGGRSTLTLWDLGGEAGFRSVWERYFREAHIVVFVLDATARARLPEARAELGMRACVVLGFGMNGHGWNFLCEVLVPSFISFTSSAAVLADKLARHAELYDAPFLVVANKCDDEVDGSGSGSGATAGAMTVDELVRALPILIPPPPSSSSSSSSASFSSVVDADASQLRPTRLVQLIPISAKSGCVEFVVGSEVASAHFLLLVHPHCRSFEGCPSCNELSHSLPYLSLSVFLSLSLSLSIYLSLSQQGRAADRHVAARPRRQHESHRSHAGRVGADGAMK